MNTDPTPTYIKERLNEYEKEGLLTREEKKRILDKKRSEAYHYLKRLYWSLENKPLE